ncbi:MAG: Ig-like domain-containing domain [Adhaeribacter sp.]
MRTYLNIALLLCITFYIYSCASIGTPEGGPKDAQAPKLVESLPVNKSLQVSGKTIQLVFDENIRLKDLNRQLIITPNTNNTFETTVSKNTLKLEFEKPFEPNTTYFINFREAVEDITEGNKAANLSLTFSTGTFLDSGQVKGTVRELYSNAAEAKTNVVLYPANDTTTIRKHKPFYFTQTDDKGNYQLQNVKDGEYRIYAHQDRNNNMIYDNDNERIGYLGNTIKVSSATPDQNLITVRIDTKKPLVESSNKFVEEYQINYNEGLSAFNILQLAKTPAPFVYLADKKGNKITVYPTAPNPSGKYLVSATDSAGNTRSDTLNITFEGKKAPRAGEAYTLKTEGSELTKDTPLDLTFKVPIKIVDPQGALTLVQDSVNRKVLNFPADLKLNPTATVLSIATPLTAKKTVQIILDTTKVLPISGDRFRKQNTRLTISNKVNTGGLSGKITTKYKRYWVEVLNKANEIVYTLDSPKTLQLEGLAPDNYRIRIKIDEDNNGQWRAGNADLTTIPEIIFHYPGTIDIKANWEIEIKEPDPLLSF